MDGGIMPLGTRKPKTFFKLRDGAIDVKVDNNIKKFDFYEGYLTNIRVVHGEYNGTPTKQWDVEFLDPDGQEFVWVIDYNAYTFQNFINCILSVEDKFGLIKLSPYIKNGKPKLAVYHNGNILSWKFKPGEMPNLEEIKNKNGEFIEYDNTERMNWIEDKVTQLNNILHSQPINVNPNIIEIDKIETVEIEDDVPF
jgi:hypothetical protein